MMKQRHHHGGVPRLIWSRLGNLLDLRAAKWWKATDFAAAELAMEMAMERAKPTERREKVDEDEEAERGYVMHMHMKMCMQSRKKSEVS